MADSLLDGSDNDPNERAAIIAKWKDKPREELEAAKAESDLYIKTLTARMDEIKNDYLKLKEESTAKASLQDLIDRHEKSLRNPDTSDNTNTENVNQPSLKPEDIDSLLEQKLSAREKTNKQTDNFNFVKAKLREQFGDNANNILKQRMETLGLDQAFVDELAKTHPTVFMKTFGMEDQPRQNGFNPPPRSSQRSDKFAPVTPKRDWNYYQELKKTNPRLYLDPKIAVQMHNDAVELGESFGMPED